MKKIFKYVDRCPWLRDPYLGSYPKFGGFYHRAYYQVKKPFHKAANMLIVGLDSLTITFTFHAENILELA